MPWWWTPLQASKYMEGAVKPWEWGEAPAFWLNAAVIAMQAEHEAHEYERKKSERKGARSRSRRR